MTDKNDLFDAIEQVSQILDEIKSHTSSKTDDAQKSLSKLSESIEDLDLSQAEDPPVPPPSFNSLPAQLSKDNPEALIKLSIPEVPVEDFYHLILRVKDPDYSNEGVLTINDSSPITLFGRTDGAHNNQTVEAKIKIPSNYLKQGDNKLKFEWSRTGGFEIKEVSIEPIESAPEPVPTPTPDPPDPTPTPPTGKTLYVSSRGDDNNSGSKKDESFKTLEKAMSVANEDESITYVLLKRGDFFENSVMPALRRGNLIIGTWGTGLRPVVEAKDNGKRFFRGDKNFDNVLVTGIYFYRDKRNPDKDDFESEKGVAKGDFCNFSKKHDSITFQDCEISHFSMGFNINAHSLPYSEGITNFTIRGCYLHHMYDNTEASKHCQAGYFKYVKNLVIEDCVFFHNGWLEESPYSERTGFNHDIYMSSCENHLIQNNLFDSVSYLSTKAVARNKNTPTSGKVLNNVYLRTRAPIQFDQNDHVIESLPIFRDITIQDNLSLESSYDQWKLRKARDSKMLNNIALNRSDPERTRKLATLEESTNSQKAGNEWITREITINSLFSHFSVKNIGEIFDSNIENKEIYDYIKSKI